MKRIIGLLACMIVIVVIFAPGVRAYELSTFDQSVEELKNSFSDDVRERMQDLGMNDITDVDQIRISNVFSMLTHEVSTALTGPLASAALIIAALVMISLIEGYTDSLRHARLKEILSSVTVLFVITIVISPVVELLRDAVSVIKGAGALMLLYLPLMVGILVFSGHLVHAGGYYATVMTAAQLISWLSSTVLSPLLGAYLAISACAGIGSRVRIMGFCDMIYRFARWTLAFAMCIFTAVLTLQSVSAGAADTVASRAARFTLSSLIPVIGSAISEAYRILQSSVNLLRSGVGIFTLIGVTVSFAPVIIRVFVWLLTLNISRCTAQMLSVDSVASTIETLSSVLSMLISVIISVLLVFLISTASLLMIGGAS